MRSVVAAALLRSHRISVSGSISYNRRSFTTQSKDRIIRLDQAFLGGVFVAAATIIFFENDTQDSPQSNALVQQNIPSEHNNAAASLHHHQSASSRVRRTLTSGLIHRQLTVPKYTIPMATAIRNDTPSKTTAECSASATDDKIQFATPIKDINKIYDIGRILGEGGYGQVVFAKRRADSKTVALKCIPKEWTDSDGFKCEIEVLQKLNSAGFEKRDPTQQLRLACEQSLRAASKAEKLAEQENYEGDDLRKAYEQSLIEAEERQQDDDESDEEDYESKQLKLAYEQSLKEAKEGHIYEEEDEEEQLRRVYELSIQDKQQSFDEAQQLRIAYESSLKDEQCRQQMTEKQYEYALIRAMEQSTKEAEANNSERNSSEDDLLERALSESKAYAEKTRDSDLELLEKALQESMFYEENRKCYQEQEVLERSLQLDHSYLSLDTWRLWPQVTLGHDCFRSCYWNTYSAWLGEERIIFSSWRL